MLYKIFTAGLAVTVSLLFSVPAIGAGHGGGHCSKRHDIRRYQAEQRAEQRTPPAPTSSAVSRNRVGSSVQRCGLFERLAGGCGR
jgi:hypothetical protein